MDPIFSHSDDEFIRKHPGLSIHQLADALGKTYDQAKARRYMILGPRDRPLMVRQTDEAHMQRWRKQYGVNS